MTKPNEAEKGPEERTTEQIIKSMIARCEEMDRLDQQFKFPGVPINAGEPGYNEHGIPLDGCVGGKNWRPLGVTTEEWKKRKEENE